ncbi:bis(5'-nucleosyl)-tetraphosphatase (symmetrical) YqeK [Thermophilibacter immobilis]|jgi:predicted HD superfamily hydrolase involved in NAD metabolism|uniref:bis(5'-nucleosyl)-tetraphosphatase (symmetrical) n=1 Tax=Thermophilibacter immobilis TaxID=2779519 RepID=A0A7S7RTS2_9ACTN|nr:bis(5'-nucleosyl)-tetraphosphatase (symmetrical) YqeK [Thermophilibacter immobilis]QOY59880.1 bis(5'-nucleosyl)-tetraphosphatase (symmetrical) YqeK [Thermophilibacter immobilis]
MAGEDGGLYTAQERALVARLEADLKAQLAPKPCRLAHSLSVARTAEDLALTYGVDPLWARVAGILHDWDKVVAEDELVARARRLGVEMGVDLGLVRPLLHGIVAARELPARYPELPDEVWHAIAVHTTAAPEMSPLDEVLFVADGIEPLRPPAPGIEKTRALVGAAPLDDVFWSSFVGGIVYVLEEGRYLYPGSIDIYNALAAGRARTR